jgi:hypothetical protein
MLYLKEPTINYKTWKSTKRPANCMYKREVWNSNTDSQMYLLVCDYYTRKGANKGWWLAFRRPGYVPRTKPKLVLYMGSDCPTIEQIEAALNTIF